MSEVSSHDIANVIISLDRLFGPVQQEIICRIAGVENIGPIPSCAVIDILTLPLEKQAILLDALDPNQTVWHSVNEEKRNLIQIIDKCPIFETYCLFCSEKVTLLAGILEPQHQVIGIKHHSIIENIVIYEYELRYLICEKCERRQSCPIISIPKTNPLFRCEEGLNATFSRTFPDSSMKKNLSIGNAILAFDHLCGKRKRQEKMIQFKNRKIFVIPSRMVSSIIQLPLDEQVSLLKEASYNKDIMWGKPNGKGGLDFYAGIGFVTICFLCKKEISGYDINCNGSCALRMTPIYVCLGDIKIYSLNLDRYICSECSINS